MFYVVTLLLLFLATLVEYAIPSFALLNGAQILVMPVVLFYGALAFSYPWVLGLAFAGGMIWGLNSANVSGGTVEISLGWSILLYAVVCSLMHGLRPLFLRGRWEAHCLMSGLCTALVLFGEYGIITFRRQGIYFDQIVWWRILVPGAIAMLVAPGVFFGMNWIGRKLGFRPLARELEGYQP